MIHVILEKNEVRDLESKGQLRSFLASIQVADKKSGQSGRFMMDLPIESKAIAGSKGEAVVYFQEELDDE
jgi:hypothetical protein